MISVVALRMWVGWMMMGIVMWGGFGRKRKAKVDGNILIRGSFLLTFLLRFSRRVVDEKEEVVDGVRSLGWGCAVFWRRHWLRKMDWLSGRKTGRRAEKFILARAAVVGGDGRIGVIAVIRVDGVVTKSSICAKSALGVYVPMSLLLHSPPQRVSSRLGRCPSNDGTVCSVSKTQD